MVESQGAWPKVKPDLKKRNIKCFVKEVYPYFLISDGQFYIAPYFTESAIKEFKANNKKKLWDLKDKIILIESWAMDMREIPSGEHFTSYANLEVRFVIKSFKSKMEDKVNIGKQSVNLFRDDEFKTLILNYQHQVQKALLQKEVKGMKVGTLEELNKNKASNEVHIGSGAAGKDFAGYGLTATSEKITDIRIILQAEKGSKNSKALEIKAQKFQEAH
jgi:hypothetical protein